MKMNKLDEVGTKTTEKILEIQKTAFNGHGSVMSVIRSNIKHWEMDLRPVCVVVGKSYNNAILEILLACGYEIDLKTLNTYLGRAREKVIKK